MKLIRLTETQVYTLDTVVSQSFDELKDELKSRHILTLRGKLRKHRLFSKFEQSRYEDYKRLWKILLKLEDYIK